MSDDDGDGGDDLGDIGVAWNLNDWDETNRVDIAGACPTSDSRAQVVVQPVAGGDPFTDVYFCTDGAGTSADLPVGTYDVFVNITSADEVDLLAQSFLAAGVTVSRGGLTNVTPFEIYDSRGQASVAWTLEDDLGAPITCAQASSNGIDITTTAMSDSSLRAFIHDCEDAAAVTDPVPIDSYTFVLSILDAQDNSIGDSVPANFDIRFGNELAELGTVVVPLAPPPN